MRIDKDPQKEEKNKKNHRIGFSLAEAICSDPLSVTVYDRYENGEDRWHIFSEIAGKVFVLVHAYPDPDDDTWIRVIGLRAATPEERKRYEEGNHD